MAAQTDLERVLDEIRKLRDECDANFSAVNNRLKTLEFGILSIAQKLLAEEEVREVRKRVMGEG